MSEFIIPPTVDNPFVQMLRAVTGAAPDEELHITTPTFERPSNLPPPMIPPTAQRDWAEFQRMDREALRAWGLQPFAGYTTEPPRVAGGIVHRDAFYYERDSNDDGGDERPQTHTLWLFPGTWYQHIPNGFPIVDIFGVLDEFERGKTDDDIRYGCLAFGVMIPEPNRAS